MPKTIKYSGSQVRWPELAYTGKQSVWRPGQQELRSDSEAALLLATGQFTDVDATVLDEAERVALSALASEAGTVDAYNTDVWQEITATGLAIPLPVTVKAIKLIGGTTPTLALRDALVDTYTAASASTDLAFDSSVTPIPLGYEFPLNKLFRLGVHATVGGTSPRWAIKI